MSDYMHIHRTQDQIAADRQRYLDFQREGIEAKTLPQPSPRPAPEAPNARLTEKVPGAWYTTLHLKVGEVLRLVPGGGVYCFARRMGLARYDGTALPA